MYLYAPIVEAVRRNPVCAHTTEREVEKVSSSWWSWGWQKEKNGFTSYSTFTLFFLSIYFLIFCTIWVVFVLFVGFCILSRVCNGLIWFLLYWLFICCFLPYSSVISSSFSHWFYFYCYLAEIFFPSTSIKHYTAFGCFVLLLYLAQYINNI